MNKFITKLAKLFLGISMAAGVGVSINLAQKKASEVGASSPASLSLSTKTWTEGSDYVSWQISDGNQSVATMKSSGTNYKNYLGGDSNKRTSSRFYNGGTVTITPVSGVTFGVMTFTATSEGYATTFANGNWTNATASASGTTVTITPKDGASSVTAKPGGTCGFTAATFEYSTSGGGGGGGGGETPASSSYVLSGDNFSKTGSGSSYADYNGERTINDVGIYSYQCMMTNSSGTKYIQFKRDSTNVSFLTNTTSFGKITKITLSSSTDLLIAVSETAFSTGTSQPTGGTAVTSGSSITGTYGYFVVKGNASSGTPKTQSITIEYAAGYTVTFDVQGHGTAPSSQKVADGGKVTQPTAPTATGYTFGGWYKEDACTNAWNFDSDTVTAATTLYAKWTASKYNINYYDQGGSAFSGTHETGYPTQHTYGAATTLKSATKDHYTFGGWFTTSSCTGTAVTSLGATSYTAAINLYAKWIGDNYIINYYDQGGSAFSGTHETGYPTQHTYGTATTLKSATKDHYSFDGWFTGSDCSGTAVTTLGATAYTAAINLYAKWAIDNFDIGGTISNGSLSSTAKVNYNDALDISIIPDTDYTYPSSIESVKMGGNQYNEYEYDSSDGSFRIEHVTGDVEITAHCVDTSAVPYTVNYSLSNCSITNAPETIYSNEIKELQIVADEHFKLPNSISISGIDSSKWSYDNTDGTILINEPDGDMTIAVECVPKDQFDVNLVMSNVSKSSGPSGTKAVEEGEEVTIVFAANPNYGLPSSIIVEMGEDTLTPGDDYTWTQGSGTLYLLELTDHLTVTISGVARDLTDESLTLGSKKTAYTLGDDFELPTTIVANFNIAPLTVDVKNDVVVSGPVENGVVTGSGTVVLTYTFAATGHTQSSSYSITASTITPSNDRYVKVTAAPSDWSGTYLIVDESSSNVMDGTLTSNNGAYKSVTISNSEIAATATINTYSFTIAKGTTDSTKYTVQSHSGYYIDRPSSGSGGGLTVSDSNAYELSIVYSTDHSEIRASCYASSGSNKQQKLQWNNSSTIFKFYNSTQRDIQLYKFTEGASKELKWITAELKSGTYYQGSSVTASDFTVTAHYNDGSTFTPTSDITVTNGYLANIGSNSVTLTYGGKSCVKTVNAVEQTATLTGLTWSQGELTIINGHSIDFTSLGTVTATYDTSPSSTKALDSCIVSTYTKSNDTYTKVADIDDGDIITSSSHGKYLGVTYTEHGVTLVAYSSAAIYVVEEIEDVFIQEPATTWSKVTSLSEGDIVTFVNESASKVASSCSSDIIHASAYEDSVSSEFYFEVGKVGSYYTFHNKNGYLGNHSTGTKGNNYAYLDSEIDDENNYNYFTVSFSEGSVVITSVYDSERTLQFNSDRFCFYGSSQGSVELYKGTTGYSPTEENIANTNAVVQKAVLQFAEHFNDIMQCVNGGSTANVSSKWSTLSGDFTTELSKFTGDNLDHYKALFANAYSIEGGDTLQDMLARYDYIVAKYKLSDFLNSATDRPEVAQSTNVSPLINIIGENTNTVAIIVIISMVSVTAIGGYFFLRKRKEN